MSTPFPTPALRARTRAVVVLVALALMTSCTPTGDAAEQGVLGAPAGATASHVGASTPVAELRTTAALGRLVGRLPGPRRRTVLRQVTAVVDGWWEAAYLAPDEETRPGRASFPGFTGGARSRAGADRTLMTNARLEGASLTPLMRKVHLDVLAVGGRARSVTARFELRVRVAPAGSGARARRLQLRGRLFLTHRPAGWRVFGYDVSRGWLR